MTKKWKPILETVIGFAVLGLAFVGCGVARVFVTGDAYYVPDDITYSQFNAKFHGRIRSAETAVTDTGPQTVVFLEPEPNWWWTLPSGPAVYVFDNQGKLIDYTFDLGDSGEFITRNPAVTKVPSGEVYGN